MTLKILCPKITHLTQRPNLPGANERHANDPDMPHSPGAGKRSINDPENLIPIKHENIMYSLKDRRVMQRPCGPRAKARNINDPEILKPHARPRRSVPLLLHAPHTRNNRNPETGPGKPAHHDKLHESRILYTGEGSGSYLCFVAGEDAHKRS